MCENKIIIIIVIIIIIIIIGTYPQKSAGSLRSRDES